MKFSTSELAGAHIVDIEPISDPRGFFARLWCASEFETLGLKSTWAQSNMQFSPEAGTLRGLHYQQPPFDEIKLVRCTAGAVFDVAVDLRPDSPSYLRWMGRELTADNHRMVWIPRGCAHGYLTLAPSSEVTYLTSHEYVAAAAVGVRYDDPAFGIRWPSEVTTIADRDLSWPFVDRNIDATVEQV